MEKSVDRLPTSRISSCDANSRLTETVPSPAFCIPREIASERLVVLPYAEA